MKFMDNALYQKFVALKEIGKKTEANTALEEFIASFHTPEEKQEWAWDFLEHGEYGHKIRHELYTEVIFPVLLEGYRRNDARSLFFLAKTAQNLYADRSLLSQVDNKGEYQLLREADALTPTEEIRHALLRWDLNWFGHCEHEYPTGILYGSDGATLAECEEILQEVEFARTLDDGTHATYLQEFEAKVREYRQRLQAK
jgi:hypothetical protein